MHCENERYSETERKRERERERERESERQRESDLYAKMSVMKTIFYLFKDSKIDCASFHRSNRYEMKSFYKQASVLWFKI